MAIRSPLDTCAYIIMRPASRKFRCAKRNRVLTREVRSAWSLAGFGDATVNTMTRAQQTSGIQVANASDSYQCARAWVALRSVYERVNESLAHALTWDCGITVNDYDVLLFIAHIAPHLPRLGDLNEAVTLSQPSLSRLIMRLEQQKLVQRVEAADDRRAVLIALTDDGRALLEKATPIHAECVRTHLTSHMSDREHEALLSTFDRIQAAQNEPLAVSR